MGSDFLNLSVFFFYSKLYWETNKNPNPNPNPNNRNKQL